MAATIASGLTIIISFTVLINVIAADNCIIGNFNLTLLEQFSPWKTVDSLNGTIYEINLCSKLKSTNCPDGTAVCAQSKNSTISVSYGNYSSAPSNEKTPFGTDGELLLTFKGQPCGSDKYYSTIFYFKCGKTLGYPKYQGENEICTVQFEWESYLFCQKLPTPDKEVPCAVVKDGSLIDLTPLIKLTGGYSVDSENDQTQILINVCRDITIDATVTDDTKDCVKGSSACKVVNKSVSDNGRPKTGLQATSEGVRLVYTSTIRPPSCIMDPSTTINFYCPKRGGVSNFQNFLGIKVR
ncbi:cation-independent mannose-6-phosphate receptor-like [Biomphalaria glabrata]|uniref:Cation-independent mannose-6-phosphate receptor-like n=1 Tax=Biomphalaria glabrata TaxID=6526 RepID=A0A9W3AMR0_BIOGL|nr:cation-independent mannose-6-phosphate receptor-like [Biomphalaria glabrata]